MTSLPAVSWHDLLAEPPVETPYWLATVYARLSWAHEACGRGVDALAALDAPMGRHLDGTIRLGRAWGDALRPPAWGDVAAAPETLGTTAPRLVVVGDMRSEDAPLPFYSRSGKWLWQALRVLGYDELGCVVTNARVRIRGMKIKRRDEELRALVEHVVTWDPAWLVLGADAAPAVRALGLPRVTYAQHPQAHARFAHKQGPAGYARLLANAGLAPGPWHGRELPTRVAPAERTALAEAYDIRDGVAFRPAGGNAQRAKQRQPAYAKLEHARRLYVTGQALTLKAAADAAGTHIDGVVEIARHERWHEERDEVTRQLREAMKAEMIQGEVKRIASARDMAWAATNLALARVLERLQDPLSKIAAGDASKLGSLAVLLSGHAPTTDEQRQVAELLAKGPDALAHELLAWSRRLRAEPEPEAPGVNPDA